VLGRVGLHDVLVAAHLLLPVREATVEPRAEPGEQRRGDGVRQIDDRDRLSGQRRLDP
jgi:hypothetical protein